MAEYAEAIDCLVDRSRVFIGQNAHKAIVVHGTGGSPVQTAQQLGEWFNTNANETSVHFGIDRSGVIAQFVRLEDGAAGNCCEESGYDAFWQPFIQQYGNLNLCTISIEHVNDLSNSLQLTDPQKQTSFKLIAWLCQTFNIPHDHIKSHASIAPITRAHCPGPAFPWDELMTFLEQQGGASMIPAGWTDDGTTLTDPEGHKVVHGFRDYILTHTWDKDDHALEEEHPEPQLELTNAALGGGTAQTFRFTRLEWTSQDGVIKCYLGREYLALKAKSAPLAKMQTIATKLTAELTVDLQGMQEIGQEIAQALKS